MDIRKVDKYLNNTKDIYNIDKIFFENLHWNGKLLVFTNHARVEFAEIGKPIEFAFDILMNGKHILISKKQNKFNVFYPYQNKNLCLSYAEHEDIIIIHIKPINKRVIQ